MSASRPAEGQSAAHLSGEWARLIFATLRDAGVSDVWVSPGSRSTPFTWAALHTGGLTVRPVIDERSAAFLALGHARVTGRPSALLCTSGTAAANYFPAVIEASQAHLPLVVLTADRPLDVQHAAASQTIDQIKLYGDFARRFYDLGLPDAAPSALVGLRRSVAQAVAESLGPLPGPVHLNLRARKPLEPAAPSNDIERALAAQVSDLIARPIAHHAPIPGLANEAVLAAARTLSGAASGIIAVGPLPAFARNLAEPIAELSRLTGFPIFAEASSQIRFALADHELSFPLFDWLLTAPSLAAKIRPEVLLTIGHTPTSSAFERWAATIPHRIVLADHGYPDALGTAELAANGHLAAALPALVAELQHISQHDSQHDSQDASQHVSQHSQHISQHSQHISQHSQHISQHSQHISQHPQHISQHVSQHVSAAPSLTSPTSTSTYPSATDRVVEIPAQSVNFDGAPPSASSSGSARNPRVNAPGPWGSLRRGTSDLDTSTYRSRDGERAVEGANLRQGANLGQLVEGANLRQVVEGAQLVEMVRGAHERYHAAIVQVLEEGGTARADGVAVTDGMEGLSEGAVVARVVEGLPEGAVLVLGNSLPIRDVDAYVTRAARVRVVSQRGVSGIDGLVSGAIGSAIGSGAPTLLLIGDVSLLHDLGGLAAASLVTTPLVIAVVDNGGGRIFDQLPVQQLYGGKPEAERLWLTPPPRELQHAAALFGLSYAAPEALAAIGPAVTAALAEPRVTLLHLRVAPNSAAQVRKRVLSAVASES